MKTFCKDRDLLCYERQIFNGQTFRQFILAQGSNATIADSYLSANNVDFIASGIGAGNVVFVEDETNGWQAAYEVVQCILAGQILISSLRTPDTEDILAVEEGSGLNFCIVSFKPIIYEVSFELARYLGLRPAIAGAEYSIDDLTETASLRTAAVFGTLARIYAIMPFGSDEIENSRIADKQAYYLEHYLRSRQACSAIVDTDEDSIADALIKGGLLKTKRG